LADIFNRDISREIVIVSLDDIILLRLAGGRSEPGVIWRPAITNSVAARIQSLQPYAHAYDNQLISLNDLLPVCGYEAASGSLRYRSASMMAVR
jgi:hypothetical protein